MGKENKKRKTRDWEAIGLDYRAGLISIRAVGRKYDIDQAYLRREAKKRGWERDLTNEVRRAVRNKLVRNKVEINKEENKEETKELTDDEVVEAAAFVELAFINEWDRRFGKTVEIVHTLKKEILSLDSVKVLVGEKLKGIGYNPSQKAAMLNAITQAEQRMFDAMRKNFGIDKADSKPAEMPDIYIDYGTGEYEAELNKRKSS